MTLEEVIAGVGAGERRAIGRAISMVERLGPEGRELAAALHPRTGRAWRVGVTGAPGVGKSTLISALIRHLRGAGRRVAVVSVDPTSPFTRGAVLGDRIRLTDHFLDPGVFIRSMASRGHLGGLAEATADAVLVLDAAGFDVVLVETVGSGQNEVEVQTLTETVVLALMPGSGDGVQAIKAGLMEIPDVIGGDQGRPPGRRPAGRRAAPTPSAWCPAAPGSRRSCGSARSRTAASSSSGPRSSATAPSSSRTAGWRRGGATGLAPSDPRPRRRPSRPPRGVGRRRRRSSTG